MKKFLTAKHLSLLMLLSLLGSKAQAGRHQYDDEEYVTTESRECCERTYEYGCNPLNMCAWDIQFQGGVNPILWTDRGTLAFVDCAAAGIPVPPVSPIFPIVTASSTTGRISRFRSFYRVPFIVGGQIGYAWSDNTRVYGEFNYSQAKSKGSTTSPLALSFSAPFIVLGVVVPTPSTINLTLAKYKLFDAYVGVQYYWDRWCDRYSFFVGGKVGLTHHKAVSTSATIAVPATLVPAAVLIPTATTPATYLFNSNTVVSGGLNVGLDIGFCGNWAFLITGEVVASCGPRSNSNIPVTIAPAIAGFAPSNLLIGNIGTELRFPVTAGIRYSF